MPLSLREGGIVRGVNQPCNIIMKEILFNLAMIDCLNFCKKHGIDPSGTHLYKTPRGHTYTLVRDEDSRPLVAVAFTADSVPQHLIY